MALTEREKVAHLLRRFGLGASEAEVEYYGKNGLKGAIDLLLNYENVEQGYAIRPEVFANQQGVVNMRLMQGIEYSRLVTSRRPLLERMTLFWHNHFATASMKVDSAYAMHNHMETLRTYATDSFRTLLTQISQDPAMIYWLDNQENVKGKPNENFAREVMELFTLGIGHYTEKDVQEAARTFTGWTYGTGFRAAGEAARAPRRIERFRFVAARHDSGEKEILGKRGKFGGNDVLDMLCDNPQTARFITHKMWTWFAYENPSDALVERLAGKFRAADLNIKVLVRAIMEAPEFYSDTCVRKHIKNPIDFVVPIIRQFGLGRDVLTDLQNAVENPNINAQNGVNLRVIQATRPGFACISPTTSMGMELLNPPDVSGWKTGAYWITSATMVERAKFADALFQGQNRGGPQNRTVTAGLDVTPMFGNRPNPETVVTTIASVLDCPLTPKSKEILLAAARGSDGTANGMALAVCKILFIAPEFQVC